MEDIDDGNYHDTDKDCTDLAHSTASFNYLQNTFDVESSITASNIQKIEEPFSEDVTSQISSAGQKLITAAKTGDVSTIDRLLQQQQKEGEHDISQDHLNVSLLEACRTGRKFIVQKLVRSGAEVNMTSTTPLHLAAEQSFVDIAAFLLNKDADVNANDHLGNSALILAVNGAGSSDLLKLLLAYGANIDHQNSEGVTALMKAVEVMDIDAVRILMLSRPTFKQMNKHGETTRDIAVRLGITGVFDSLKLEAEERWYSTYLADSTNALSKAALTNCTETVKIILDCSDLEIEIDWKGPHERKIGNQNAKISALVVLIESICSDAKENKDTSDVKLEVAKLIIESGIEAKKAERAPLSGALVDATQSGFYKLVEVLCKVKNIEINSLKRGQSALMVAAEIGRLDLVKLLLDFGADPKTENDKGEIALTYALTNSQIECAYVLIQKHKPPERKLQELARMAVQKCQYESLRFLSYYFDLFKISQDLMESGILTWDTRIVQFLVDHGADVNGNCSRDNFPLLITLENSRCYNLSHNRGDGNLLDMIKFLVKRGACVNRIPPKNSPLVTAVRNSGKSDVPRYLLKHGADVNQVGDKKGNTPLTATFTRYSTMSPTELHDTLEAMLKAGADPNKANCDGNTALHLAAYKDDLGTIIQLIDAGADLEARNSDEMTPMLLAAREGQPEVIMLLKDCGANMKAVDKDGKNAVFQSLRRNFGHYEKRATTLQVVASNKDEVNIKMPDGQTPLMLAAEHCDIEAIKTLLVKGADPHKMNKKQETALSILFNSFLRMSEAMTGVKILITHGALLSLPKRCYINLHRMILSDERELAQLMVTNGMAPMCVDFSGMKASVYRYMENISNSVWRNFSPLAAALMGNRLAIARYLVANWFLTPADIVGSDQLKDIRNALGSDRTSEIHKYLDEYMSQPMSLMQLSFVGVSSQLGETIGREERVRKAPLPIILQDMLLFKKENCSMEFTGKEENLMFAD